MWMHSTFKDEVWLWRGQADKRFGIEPAMHTRVLNADGRTYKHEQATVGRATTDLIDAARKANIDTHEAATLPDLALLASIQHHGAATPLLDVTTDPLVALWMVAFANPSEPTALDSQSGRLFAIRRPPRERWIEPMDARPFAGTSNSVTSSLGQRVWWYRPPDVTERLRMQRGSFLLGELSKPKGRNTSTIPLELGDDSNDWVSKRFEKRGQASNTSGSGSPVEAFSIVVRGSAKRHLRALLSDRSGLTIESVYPTPWHRPLIDQFGVAYGRARPLEFDLSIADDDGTDA